LRSKNSAQAKSILVATNDSQQPEENRDGEKVSQEGGGFRVNAQAAASIVGRRGRGFHLTGIVAAVSILNVAIIAFLSGSLQAVSTSGEGAIAVATVIIRCIAVIAFFVCVLNSVSANGDGGLVEILAFLRGGCGIGIGRRAVYIGNAADNAKGAGS
jgi:hypothetical protein